MSLTKSTTRRLSLLAGASLTLAGLTAFAGLTLAPTSALAQSCTPTAVNVTASDSAADAVQCTAGTFASGIAYSSSGPLSVTMIASGAVVNSTITNDGVDLTGNGTDSVTFNSAVGTLTGGAGTAGPVVSATSVSGAINITTNGVAGTQAGTTYAIYAKSSGNGAINITRTAGAVNNNVAGGIASIWAETNGGVVNITTAGATTGRGRGIMAKTSGAAAITLNIGGNVSANATDGVAGIDTVAGTGATTINITSGTTSGGLGPAIRSVSASTSAATAVSVQNTGGVVSGRVDFSGVSAGGVTFNNATAGRWTATGTSVFTGFNDTLTMNGAGANTTASGTAINLGAGNDTWTLGASLAATGTTVDFGTGSDAFNMSGVLAVNGLTLNNLEAFNHSGVIYMGGTSGTATDGAADDVLRLTGGTFTGSGLARVVMDVTTGAGAQEGCATVTLGDCLDLRGASTAGVTVVTLNDLNTNAAEVGSYNAAGITLVDVGGAGTSAAGHFVLDPDMAGYVQDRTVGGALARPGLFVYALRYDAANQRHVLVGLPRSEATEYAMLSGAAQSIWHMTSETVTDRQGDLRAGAQAGTLWMRASGEYTKRDVTTALGSFGDTLGYDNSYKLYAGAVIGGVDLLAGSSGGYEYVAGAQLGYVGSSFSLDASPSTGRFTGATTGAYASVWSDRLFLDGTFNVNLLTLDHTSPGLASQTNTYLNSVGGQAEGGLHVALTDRAFAEPLVTLAYVRTSFEEISLDGGIATPADAESLRAALGVRLGAALAGPMLNISYFVTGRAWNEFEGGSAGVIRNGGADLAFSDEFSGGFGEVEGGLNVYNDANTLSGFLTTGVKMKEGYSAVNLSLGVRMAW